MSFVSKIKPSMWAVTPGLVGRDWTWFWDGSFLSGGPLWEGQGNPYDYGDRSFATLISDAEWKPSRTGISLELNDDAHDGGDTIELTNFDTTQLNSLTEFTYAIYFEWFGSADANEDTIGFQWSDLQGSNVANAERILTRYDSNNKELDFFTEKSGGAQSLTVSADLSDALPHALVFRYNSSGTGKSIWKDGIQLGSNGDSGALRSSAHAKVPEVFGGFGVTGDFSRDSPRIRGYCWAFHNKAWSDAEIRQWSTDPFGPFRMADEAGVVYALAAAVEVDVLGPYGQQQPVIEVVEVVGY